jgi:AcrR family transcriptional regulator
LSGGAVPSGHWQNERFNPTSLRNDQESPLTGTTSSPPTTKTVRDRLIDAAEVCLSAKGIRSTTVSEVAEVAGLSRGWLYRHFPDKVSLLGAAIVRLNNEYWSEAHAVLERVDGLAEQIAAGIRHGRTAYDDPGALLMKLRREEPAEFAACAGAGVQGLVPGMGCPRVDLAGDGARRATRSRRFGRSADARPPLRDARFARRPRRIATRKTPHTRVRVRGFSSACG